MTAPAISPRVGAVRPSQLMFSYGVGAVVDLPNFSVIVAGLDGWADQHQERITEDRLLAAVRAELGHKVVELRAAPWIEETRNPFDEWSRIGVPVFPFPRWLRCTGCGLLSTVDGGLFDLKRHPVRPDLARYVHTSCGRRGKPPMAVPARFVTACANGHLDEFPWEWFCHHGQPCTDKPILELYEIGSGSRSTDLMVQCRTCGQKQLLQHAFGSSGKRLMPGCRGRHPHLRRFDAGGCDQQARAMFLGASNAWFPVTRSALAIPASADPIVAAVAAHWVDLAQVPSREALGYVVPVAQQLRALLGLDLDRLWTAIEARRSAPAAAGAVAPDLLAPEWGMLTDPTHAPSTDDFRLQVAGPPTGFTGSVMPIVLAERLREVVALCGFTRVDGPDSGVADDQEVARVAPLEKTGAPTWVPAAETRGEGLFIQLPEAEVDRWLQRVAGTARLDALRRSHQRWRTARGLDPAAGWPGERYVLLHTLAHALIQAVALECGYGAASIRERIYAREAGEPGGPMAGLLLYTAAPDAEGTLGGLVSLGQPDTFGRILTQALDRAALCSADPLCAEHVPTDSEETLHNAACHACLFVPETSCERGNRFLDRAVLTDTLAGTSLAYFR